MSTFVINQKQRDDFDLLVLSGVIDEEASFTKVDKKSEILIMDLEGVEYINSCGIRDWIKWLEEECSGYQEIIIEKCPHHIIEISNVVTSFFNDKFKVKSFYVPYYIEETDDVYNKLFERDKDFPTGKLELPETIETPKGEAELDVIASKFLKFLTKFV